ncbi:MAG TPA: hypothetical protein VLZ11_01725 [Flavobacterium sp.]|nr:hypothetical protein [Flavobacterium sp.]
MENQNYILYFTHGSDEFLNEAVFALLSYYAHHKEDENKIIVYTDNSAYFKKRLPQSIEYIALDKETIKKWKGAIDFIHRAKIELLRDFATRYTGNVLYLDSDTYFRTNISILFEHIQNGNAVMSLEEGAINSSPIKHLKDFDRYFKKNNHQLTIGNTSFRFKKDVRMYNAGIIGTRVPESARLFDEALRITDYIYPEHPSHVVEQFAFSYLLQTQNQRVIEAEPLIHHYWYFKEFRVILKDFFETYKDKSFEELLLLYTKINPEYLGGEKLRYKNASFTEKLRIKITSFRKWKIRDYQL